MFKKPLRMRYRKMLLLLFDIFCFAVIAALYYVTTKVDNRLSAKPIGDFLINCATLLGWILLVRIVTGTYFKIWRYTNTNSLLMLAISDALGGIFAAITCNVILSRIVLQDTPSIWLFIVIASLNSILTLVSRFVYRIVYKYFDDQKQSASGKEPTTNRIPVAIVGAGQAGYSLVHELLSSRHSNYKPMFFIDNSAAKIGNRVANLKVYPENEAVLDLIREQGIAEIFIAVTSLNETRAANLYHFYSRTSCKIKIYDTEMRDMGGTGKPKHKLREFQIEDLLFRKSIHFLEGEARNFYSGKVILVTGGGGSIGSELCRQIAACEPKQLIILDIYENNAYDIQQELSFRYRDKLDLRVVIASVRDRERMDAVFAEFRPEIVFHAAAHKHVPLMENNMCEAIKNNVFGTNNTADMAEKYGAEKFILISTDKAVNPTNIMGASKRLCEMVVQCRTDSKTAFAAVRFGNVLGSNGSVIPLFRKQIEEGGPVTITDKRIIRYFMTIPEASQLVMQAGAMAKRGELFVLDMGKPVLIYDLAVNMIRLSGLVPDEDIEIKEIGLRPGEKLYEELLIKTENLDKTDNNLIFVERDHPNTREEMQSKLNLLARVVKETQGKVNAKEVKEVVRQVVPTFRDPEEVNRNAAQSEEMKLCHS